MSRKFVLIPAVLLLASCLGRQQQPEAPVTQEGNIRQEKELSDSLLNEVFASLAEITENLNTIKVRENLISSSYPAGEIPIEPTAVIRADIAAIDELLAENRRALDRLQHNAVQLRKANGQVASLERLLSSFADQIASKDQEISLLKEQLRITSEQVEVLSQRVDDISQQRDALEGELGSTADRLHTAYYVVGKSRELQKMGITGKSGFIGRTTVVSDGFDPEGLTSIDTRTFDQLILGHKNVEVVTTHPEGSYVFVMGDRGVFQSLVITDKERFWASSKILVVSYK